LLQLSRLKAAQQLQKLLDLDPDNLAAKATGLTVATLRKPELFWGEVVFFSDGNLGNLGTHSEISLDVEVSF
jgi:hypothetical protein